jgi:hypothetical protein
VSDPAEGMNVIPFGKYKGQPPLTEAERKFDDLVRSLGDFTREGVLSALAASIDTTDLRWIASQLGELCDYSELCDYMNRQPDKNA